MQQETNKKIAVGAVWMILIKLTERSIGLVSTVVLTHLLLPADFGLVAMAMLVAGGLELLGAFSFDVALIQNHQATEDHYNTAWTLNILFFCALAVVLAALAWPAAMFYNEPRLVSIILVMALGMGLGSFGNVGTIEFRKQLLFKDYFILNVAKKIASFSVTMVIAFTFRNYWALVLGTLAGRLFGVWLSYHQHPYRPRFCVSKMRELFGFSTWMFFNNMLSFFQTRSADFVIGKVAGAHALGVYSVAYEISNLTSTELVAPINRAVFPGYAKIAAENPGYLKQGYLAVLGIIALVSMPIAAGIAVTSHAIVPLMLGDHWLEAVPIIQILAFYGMVNALQTNATSLYAALGIPRVSAMISMMMVVVLVPALVISINMGGTIGGAWGFLIVAIVMMPVNFAILFSRIKLGLLEFFSVLWRPAVSTALMYGAVSAYQQRMTFVGKEGLLLDLFSSALLGATVYVVCVLSFWRLAGAPQSTERRILEIAAWRLNRLLGRRQEQV